MTKALKNLWVFDPNRDVSDNWLNADPLHFAWLAYSPLEKQNRYRDSGSKSPAFAKSLQFEMQLELKDRIANGELLALGIQTSATEKRDAGQIPKLVFAANHLKFELDHDRISGLGLTFDEVRICRPAGSNSNPSKTVELHLPIPKRGGGRPSRYPEAKEVLEILFRDENYRKMRAGPLWKTFNKEFKKRFAPPDQNIASVSERSLQDYLKRYRKKLAETGRD